VLSQKPEITDVLRIL